MSCTHAVGVASIERPAPPVRGPHFWPRNVVKRGICYGKVCTSVYLSVTLMSHALTVQDVEINFAPCD